MKSAEAFAEELIRLRTKKRLTQRGLAREVGLSASTISSLEKGVRQPSFEVADQLAGYFGVALSELLGSGRETESGQGADTEKEEAERIIHITGPDLDLTLKVRETYVIEYQNGVMKGSVSI